MKNLKAALAVAGVLQLFYGVTFLFPDVASSIYEYVPADMGLLSLGASLFIILGIITLAAAAQAEKVAGLAWAFALGQVVGFVHLAWQYSANVFSLRTALPPAILTLVLAVWTWMAKPAK